MIICQRLMLEGRQGQCWDHPVNGKQIDLKFRANNLRVRDGETYLLRLEGAAGRVVTEGEPLEWTVRVGSRKSSIDGSYQDTRLVEVREQKLWEDRRLSLPADRMICSK